MAKKFFDFAWGRHYHRAPMFGALPNRITLDQLMAAGGRLQGTVSIAALPRLVELLATVPAANVTADAELTFHRDPQGRDGLQGRVRAQLSLRCERCQGLLPWPVESRIGLCVVADETAASALPEDIEYVLAAGSLDVLALIEDELILSLPLVPRHPPGTECGDRVWQGPVAQSGERGGPFAILRKLKT